MSSLGSMLIALFAFHLQALDTFNTAIVSPIYYVMFTSLTILASVIMFKVTFHHKMYISLYSMWIVVALVHESNHCFYVFKTGLGSAKRYSDCHRNVWVCYNTFRNFSSP